MIQYYHNIWYFYLLKTQVFVQGMMYVFLSAMIR